jgi:hypothetical protein
MKRLTVKASMSLIALACGTAYASTGTFYTSEAAFATAAGSTSLQSFESAPGGTATNMIFSDMSVSCTGTKYCPGFFGQRNLGVASDGVLTVFFATPDTITFTFAASNAFGIDVIGLGTVGASTMTMSISNGDAGIVATAYTGTASSKLFAGYVNASTFTSVTFSATAPDDGIDFDRAQLAAVPEPASYALMALGLAGLAGATRMRKRG